MMHQTPNVPPQPTKALGCLKAVAIALAVLAGSMMLMFSCTVGLVATGVITTTTTTPKAAAPTSTSRVTQPLPPGPPTTVTVAETTTAAPPSSPPPTEPPTTTPPPTTTAPPPPTTISSRRAMEKWLNDNNVVDSMTPISSDLDDLQTAAELTNFPGLKRACLSLQRHIPALTTHLPSPDPRLDRALTSVHDHYMKATVACINGVDYMDAADIGIAGDEIKAATSSLDDALAILKEAKAS